MKLKVQGTEVSCLSFNYLIDFCVIIFFQFDMFFFFVLLFRFEKERTFFLFPFEGENCEN